MSLHLALRRGLLPCLLMQQQLGKGWRGGWRAGEGPGGPGMLVSAGEGVRAASLPRAPLPGMEAFPGVGGIAKGSGACSAPSSPA